MAEPKPIAKDSHLWRRVPDIHWFEVEPGVRRASSAAFQDDPDGSPVSTPLKEESTLAQVFDPVRSHTMAFALAKLPACVAFDKEQQLIRAPTADEPAHVLLIGNKTKSLRNAFVRGSTWAWPPPWRPYP
ncbi:MAG: hypothetical protein EXR76_15045 [Myxococcales bacterium]|nr:hypothetical protein [Myxococcales bacterium]